MPAHWIAEVSALLPSDVGRLAFFSAVGGICGIARAAHAAGSLVPTIWSVVGMMIVGLALGGIAGGVCMAKFGADDSAFYWTTAVSGLFGFIGPPALELLKTLVRGTKGMTP